jgi:preprotein translocase subunit SecA
MGPIYRGLGLTVAAIEHGMDGARAAPHYRRDVTYITNSELGFDYLRDNMAFRVDQLVLREETPLHFAIIDEVDSILVDEARTPLIISGPADVAGDKYYVMARSPGGSKGERGEDKAPPTGDYTTDDKSKDIHLTEQGIAKAEKSLGVEDIFSPPTWSSVTCCARRCAPRSTTTRQAVRERRRRPDRDRRRVHRPPDAGAALR